MVAEGTQAQQAVWGAARYEEEYLKVKILGEDVAQVFGLAGV